METFTVLLHTEGLPTRTALSLLNTLQFSGFVGLSSDDVAIDAIVLAILLVAAVHASAVLVALLTRRETLAVKFHAF